MAEKLARANLLDKPDGKFVTGEYPVPEPAPGEVRIKVHAVGLNHLDIWVRKGLPHLKINYPHLLGSDIAGEIDALGDGVDKLKTGAKAVVHPATSCGQCPACLSGNDNLCSDYKILGENTSGGYAQFVCVPAVNVLAYPEKLSYEEAASVLLPCLTAYQMIRKTRLKKGEDILIQAAGSGVSSAAIQIARAKGARIKTVYSAEEALAFEGCVFFGIGFETTAPGNAMAIHQAQREGITNFSELVSHVLVPPAMTTLLSSPKNRVQAYLAAGHVCAIMGWREYEPIAKKYKVPIVPTGFEPIDVLEGILLAVQLLEEGCYEVTNQYLRAVQRDGNRPAQDLVNKVYEVGNRKWRGIGEIPQSGLNIRKEFSNYDAEKKFNVGNIITQESDKCIAGIILQGLKKPHECPAFGKECTPMNPLGATMVSSEGACAAYYKYQRIEK